VRVRVTVLELATPLGTFRVGVLRDRETPEASTVHWTVFEVEGLNALVPAYCAVMG
jgi:hypothetical protein